MNLHALPSYAHTAPSGFPRDVSVVSISSQSAEVSWNPPLQEERNGIIVGYIVTVSRQGMDTQLQLTSTTTTITLNMLNPFTTYTITVTTSTAVGVGPPSTQLSFTTAEDGNYEVTSYYVYSCY